MSSCRLTCLACRTARWHSRGSRYIETHTARWGSRIRSGEIAALGSLNSNSKTGCGVTFNRTHHRIDATPVQCRNIHAIDCALRIARCRRILPAESSLFDASWRSSCEAGIFSPQIDTTSRERTCRCSFQVQRTRLCIEILYCFPNCSLRSTKHSESRR